MTLRALPCGRWMIGMLLVLAGCTLPTAEGDSDSAVEGAPVVQIAAPQPNATYLEDVSVNIQAAVSNAGTDISRVEITVDGDVIADLQSPNASGARFFTVTQTWPAAGLGTHTLAVTAYRGDGSSSVPQSVTINVVEPQLVQDTPPTDENGQDTNAPVDDPTPTEQVEPPTDAPPTDIPEPTEPPAPPTSSVPMARFTTGINVRSGPGTNFNPPIGQFAANTSAEILAVNPAGSWFKVRYGSTGEGWVFAQLVEVEGDITSLPREVGPPTPVPPTPTPTTVPVTATPSVTNNLVVINPYVDPPQPNCRVPFTAGMTIRNDGTGSLSTGTSRIRIVRASDNTEIASSAGALVPVTLESSGTHSVNFTFTVDVYVGELHRIQFIADADNQVAETIETDNMITVDYTLPANCP